MELNGLHSDNIARKYTWGLDLSGSLEGAGGIGGLLAAEDMGSTTSPTTGDERTFLYTYDGNGNVGQLIETTSGAAEYGTIQAHYEYHVYGKRLNSAASGEYDQPYGFSTKPFDETTGLGYWGYRYYSSDLGRWMKRDPLEERGGSHLYTYVQNKPMMSIDSLGKQAEEPLPPRSESAGRCGTDITDWLVEQLNTNRTADKIAPRMCRCTQGKPGSVAIDLCDCIDGFLKFTEKVEPEGDWDWKRNEKLGVDAELSRPSSGCRFTVSICGKCFSKDVPGNINYGYVGSVGCLPLSTLLWGGNKVSLIKTGRPDSSEDRFAIILGAALDSTYPRGLDRDTFCSVFDMFDGDLNQDGTANCEPAP